MGDKMQATVKPFRPSVSLCYSNVGLLVRNGSSLRLLGVERSECCKEISGPCARSEEGVSRYPAVDSIYYIKEAVCSPLAQGKTFQCGV